MKAGVESPVIYDFIRRYTIQPYLKGESLFYASGPGHLERQDLNRIRCESTARKYTLSTTAYERIFGRERERPRARYRRLRTIGAASINQK